MHCVNIRQLKNNPTEALRQATLGPVLVLKGDLPEAVILHLGSGDMAADADLRLALATALFQEGVQSLGRAARTAGVGPAELSSHLSRLGIPVIQGEHSDIAEDLQTLDQWLASS